MIIFCSLVNVKETLNYKYDKKEHTREIHDNKDVKV